MNRALFAELGLPADADERAVKRAYAQRLRDCRPDDDPAGFQRLHEIYREALEIVRRRPAFPSGHRAAFEEPAQDVAASIDAADDADDGAGEDFPWEDEDEYLSWEAPPIDSGFPFDAFLAELETRGRSRSAAELREWLDQHPDLYSLTLKASITVPVLDRACDWQPPLPVPALEEVAAFFGAERLGRRDWWVLGKLQALCQRERLRAEIARRELPGRGQDDSWIDRLVEDEITGRAHRLQSLRRAFLVLFPGFPSRVHQRIQDLDARTDGAIDAFIPEGTRPLYATLANRGRLGFARIGLSWVRIALAICLLPLVLILFGGSPNPLNWLQLGAGLALLTLLWQVGRVLVVHGFDLIRNRENAGAWWRRASTGLWLAVAIAAACSPWDWLRALAYYLAYVAAVAASGDHRRFEALALSALLWAVDWMLMTWGGDMPVVWRGFAGVAMTPLLILGWDALLARRKGKSLDPVTGLGGPLWPLVAIVAAVVVIQFNLVMRL